MTKRILAVILAATLGLCMFTACGKKDDTQSDTQTQQTATAGEADATEQNEDGTQAESEASDKAEAPAEPIEMTTEEFEDLVDTFNNPKSDAEKEEARIKLEAVLKQMEQAQQ